MGMCEQWQTRQKVPVAVLQRGQGFVRLPATTLAVTQPAGSHMLGTRNEDLQGFNQIEVWMAVQS